MIERREREGEREKERQKERYREGGRDKRERETGERDRDSDRESKILVKSPKPRNKAQRKVDYKNYDAITMRRNYDMKLSATRNYEEKLIQEIISQYIMSRKMWELQGY